MIKILVLIFGVLIIVYNYNNQRLLSSSSVWVFCYVLIFILYPVYEKEIVYKKELLIDILALVGIIMFFLGLTVGSRCVIKKDRHSIKTSVLFPQYRIANICFWICCAISMVVLVSQIGTSGIMSVISGSMTSKQFVLESDSSSSLYVFSVHLLVPCVLALWMTAETKRQRINSVVCMGIYVLETVFFGFTRIFLISIFAMILLYELRKKEQKKQLILVAIGITALVAILVSMNFIRTFGMSSDRSIKDILDLEYVFDSTDFSASYYWFDELLNFKSPYINPVVYLKPIFAFVPRSIWESKPEPLSMQILMYVNPARAATGYSTAGNSVLGEGYAMLSYFGVVLFPFIWGTLCGKLDRRYYQRLDTGADHCLQNIYYYIFAVFIVISGQRGDWCQYMTIVIWFYMLPMYVMSKVSLRRSD